MAGRLRTEKLLSLVSVLALSLGAGGVGPSGAASRTTPGWALHGPYSPTIRPANFVSKVDNPYFPLKPGTTFRYHGYSGRAAQTDDMTVTNRTKTILGIRCVVVRDTVSEHGKPIERTFDWYAQDRHGNVWYMGENSLELENGRFVRADDSWQSGVRGARPGIIMQGDPRAGQVYRQEYYPPGGALDQARVRGFEERLQVSFGAYAHVLATDEWSPVEPQLERKYYARGVGEVEEQVIRGAHERFQLVGITR